MRVFLYVLILLFSVVTGSVAQQNPIYSQYMFNGLVINPAYAGSKQFTSSTLFFRRQWLGFKGAPLTASATIHGPIKDKRAGLGFIVNSDHVGVVNQTDLYGCYSYKIPIKEGNLAFGISGGISFYKSDLSELTVWDANDPVYNVSVFTNQLPNFGAGVYYSTEKWYAGFSVPQMFSYKNTLDNQSILQPAPHYYLTAGYVFDVSEDVKLKPSFLVRYVDGIKPLFDINMNVLLNNIVWIGASYRYNDSMIAIFEYQLNRKLRFGYAFDYPLSEFSAVSYGSHEIMLGFDFGYQVMKMKNPRYF